MAEGQGKYNNRGGASEINPSIAAFIQDAVGRENANRRKSIRKNINQLDSELREEIDKHHGPLEVAGPDKDASRRGQLNEKVRKALGSQNEKIKAANEKIRRLGAAVVIVALVGAGGWLFPRNGEGEHMSEENTAAPAATATVLGSTSTATVESTITTVAKGGQVKGGDTVAKGGQVKGGDEAMLNKETVIDRDAVEQYLTLPEVNDTESCLALLETPTATELVGVDLNNDGESDLIAPDPGVRKPVEPGDMDARQFTDAFNTPLKGENAEKKFMSYTARLCEDPYLAAQLGHVLANIKVNNKSLSELNPWLEKYSNIQKLNDVATDFLPGLDKELLSDNEVNQAIEQVKNFELDAARMIILLERLNLVGQDELIHVNQTYTHDALQTAGLPEIRLSHNGYTGEMLILSADLKDGSCIFKLLVNTLDGRAVAYNYYHHARDNYNCGRNHYYFSRHHNHH